MAQDAIYNINLMISTAQIIIALLFTLLFHQEWRKQKRSANEQYIPYALMLLYSFLFLGAIMITYSNFFAGESLLHILQNTQVYFYFVIGFIVVVTGILIFIAERIIRKNTKHFFLFYFVGMVITLIILKRMDISVFLGFNFVFGIPILVLIVLFVYQLVWKTSGQIRQKMIIVIIGFGLYIVAIIQEIYQLLHTEQEVFGIRGIILLASILAGYGFYSIPSFTEFDWADKIRHLYILNPDGLCLFQHSFKSGSMKDEDLFGGSLMAIQSLMKEMIQSEKTLKVIDHGDAKIIFERSPHAVGIMVADDDLYIVHHKVQEILTEFERLFGPQMKDWKGNLDLFYPLRPFLESIFEIED